LNGCWQHSTYIPDELQVTDLPKPIIHIRRLHFVASPQSHWFISQCMCQVSDVRHGNTAALSPSFFKFCPAYNQSVYHLFVFVLSLCRGLDQAEQFYPLSSSWTFRLSHSPIDGFTRGFSSCLCNVGPYNDLTNYLTRTAFCMAIAQAVAVITYRRFGITLRSHLQALRIQDS